MLDKIKAALKNRAVLGASAFVLGGVATGLFLQEKIVHIKKASEAHAVEISKLEQELSSERSKSRETSRDRRVHRERTREKRPDGTVITHDTLDTRTIELSKLLERDRDLYEASVASAKTASSASTSETTIHTNPKRLVLFVGTDVLNFKTRVYYGGFAYNVWGPITVGGIAGSNGLLVPTLGIRF